MSFAKFSKSAYEQMWTTPAKSGMADRGGELPKGGGIASSGKEVGLILLDVPHEFSESLASHRCGGAIGKSGQVCIKYDCTTVSHSKKKHELVLQEEKPGYCVFIKVSKADEAIHGSPIIPLAIFGDSWEMYKDQTREIEGWESLFAVLKASKEEGFAEGLDTKEMEKLTSKAASRIGPTPFKAARKLSWESVDDKDGLDFDDLADVLRDASSEVNAPEEMFIANLQRNWPPLISAITVLKRLVDSSKEQMKSSVEALREDLGSHEIDFVRLRALIGTRSDTQSRESVFERLDKLENSRPDTGSGVDSSRIGGIEAGLTSLMEWANEWTQNKLGDGLYGSIASLHSDRNQNTADIQRLQQEMLLLQQKLQSLQGGTSSGSNVQFSTSAYGRPSAPAPVSSTSASMVNLGGSSNVDSRLKALEIKTVDLESQVRTSSVLIRTEIFSSLVGTRAWLTQHVRDPSAYLLFVDLHSFFAIITADKGASPTAFAKGKAEAKKAGFADTREASVLASFLDSLPVVFGETSDSATTKFDTRDMPALPSFKEFGHAEGTTGLYPWLLARIDEVRDALLRNADGVFPNPQDMRAHAVATHMITQTAEAAAGLLSWMATSYEDHLRKRAQEKEAWRLVTQSVRSMLSTLHDARSAGRLVHHQGGAPGTPEDHRAHIVWACVCGYARLATLRHNKFSNDPAAYNSLFKFIRDQAVLQTQFEEYQKKTKKTLDSHSNEITKLLKKT